MLLAIIIVIIVMAIWWYLRGTAQPMVGVRKDVAINKDGTPDPWGRTPEQVVATGSTASAHFYGTYDSFYCDDPRVEKLRDELLAKEWREMEESKIAEYMRQQHEDNNYILNPKTF